MQHNKTRVKGAGVVECGVPQITDWPEVGGTLKVTQFHSCSWTFQESITSILFFQKVVSPVLLAAAQGHTLSSVLLPQDETHHPKVSEATFNWR